jgi:hypothetical protein
MQSDSAPAPRPDGSLRARGQLHRILLTGSAAQLAVGGCGERLWRRPPRLAEQARYIIRIGVDPSLTPWDVHPAQPLGSIKEDLCVA